MAKKKKEQQAADQIENVQNAISKSEAFIEKYQNQILYSVLAVVVLVLAVLAFRNYYVAPKQQEAQAQLSIGERYFAVDSFKVALEGNGIDYIGFKEIVDQYGITDAANVATVYAGISCYKLGQYEEAIKYLKKFDNNGDVNVTPMVLGLTGDAYVELGEVDKGIKFFLKAAKKDNPQISPIYLKKAGVAYESKGEYDKAVEVYAKIKDKYFKSNEAQDIEKYIERANALIK